MQMSTAVGNTLYFDCFGAHAELAPGNMWNDYFTVGNVLVGERVVNAATEQVTQSYFFHTDHLGSISVITIAQHFISTVSGCTPSTSSIPTPGTNTSPSATS
jgi:hypothetical protein